MQSANSYLSHDVTYKFTSRSKTTIDQRPTIISLEPWHGDIGARTTVTINGYGFGRSIDDIEAVYAGPAAAKWKWTVVSVSATCIVVKSSPLPAAVFRGTVGGESSIQAIDLVVVTRHGGGSVSHMKWCWTHGPNPRLPAAPIIKPLLPVAVAAPGVPAKKSRRWITAQSQGNPSAHTISSPYLLARSTQPIRSVVRF